jgi:hypothetical protein
MATKYDLVESLVQELSKLQELFLKGATRTSSGSGSWTSTSSSTTYNYTAGEDDLYAQLQTVLEDYQITASDWNTVNNKLIGTRRDTINIAMGGWRLG